MEHAEMPSRTFSSLGTVVRCGLIAALLAGHVALAAAQSPAGAQVWRRQVQATGKLQSKPPASHVARPTVARLAPRHAPGAAGRGALIGGLVGAALGAGYVTILSRSDDGSWPASDDLVLGGGLGALLGAALGLVIGLSRSR